MDPSSLYREEVVTDRRIGSIRVLTPLKADGSTDLGRPVLYVGEAQLLTPAGVLPLVRPAALGDWLSGIGLLVVAGATALGTAAALAARPPAE